MFLVILGDVEKIYDIAKKYNLKVIYDAAHAIGSKYKNEFITIWRYISDQPACD